MSSGMTITPVATTTVKSRPKGRNMTTRRMLPMLAFLCAISMLAQALPGLAQPLIGASGAAARDPKAKEPYALIFGTVYGPDTHPLPGVAVVIRRRGAENGKRHKKDKWERTSDAHGEFAVRVPAGKAEYLVTPRLKDRQAAEKAAVTVKVENEERQDVSLHLTTETNKSKRKK